MITHNPFGENEIIRGADLAFLIDEINANELTVDPNSASLDKNPTGTLLSILLQAGGGGDSASAVESHPFAMSVSTNESAEKVCKISTGNITTNTPYNIPAGEVNINSFGVGTVYIYLKVDQDWTSGSDLASHPVLTVQTAEGSTNFAGNDTKFPAIDFGTYFYPIGTIVITDTSAEGEDPNLSYKVNQLLKDNLTISAITLNGFTLHQWFVTKASDIADDSSVELYCTTGQASTPSGSQTITTSSQTVSTSSSQQVYLLISGSDQGGYADGFTTQVLFQNNPTSTDDNQYYLIGTGGSGLGQVQEGNFISPSRVW